MTAIKYEGADFWDANPCGGRWENYREFMTWIQRTEPYAFSVLNSYEWRGKTVLEVGCGQGTTVNYLPSLGANVFGMDLSFNSIMGTRVGAIELGSGSKLWLLQADAEAIPLASASYDIVISFGVLHHTPDTAGAIREIHRLLKPGGQAIVMVYKSGNPKWWMTRLLRIYAHLMDKLSGQKGFLANRLRARQEVGNPSGTALLELFGVPILKAFSNSQCREMFSDFKSLKIKNYAPGFRRLIDIFPSMSILGSFLGWLDSKTQHTWGFYQVIEAKK